VTLLSTQQGLGGAGRGLEDDAELAGEVISSLPPDLARAVRTVPGYLAPMRCAEIIASHRGLLSMRMHPAIFGLSRGVPTVLLTEAFKATAMFGMLGLDGSVFGWAEREEAVERLGGGWNGSADALTEARSRSAANDEVVRRLLAAL
jgi:polysaccharide pyruvyl transferase WcaK-like protein